MSRLRFGILGTARIAREAVIGPLQRSERCSVVAIASRDASAAARVASEFDIPRSHGSYEALLADPEVDAVYVPLPNHLHVPWSLRAAEAGKHVLCEKPLGLSAAEVERLIEARDRHRVRIEEAFMVRSHPRWQLARKLIEDGRIGTPVAIQARFGFHLTDPTNVRNVADWGGGAMYDIGCYPITMSRYLVGREPLRVAAVLHHDPVMQVDRLGAVLLEFDGVLATFICGTQMVRNQALTVLGSEAALVVETPFTPAFDVPTRIVLELGKDERETIEVKPAQQYGLMGDAFAASVLDGAPPRVTLEDSRGNARVIDAVFTAAKERRWVDLG